MFNALFEFIYALFKLLLRNSTDLLTAVNYLGELVSSIIGVLAYCLPDILVGVLITSIGFMIVLKIIQFH